MSMPHLEEYRRSALARHLRQHIRGEVHDDSTTRKLYSTDASIYQMLPMVVVVPRSVVDLQTTVQIAQEHGIPIVARGGGTSLSGQTVGTGIILDTSKYLNQILAIDPKRKRATVQPGVILDQLNRALAQHGLQFGPDVSTANRATIGGMIGNNSAGSHSIVYGKTINHVLSLNLILSDGSPFKTEVVPINQKPPLGHTSPLAGDIYSLFRNELPALRPMIEARYPKILRRVSGYNLDAMQADSDRGVIDLAKLIVGSEGTLALVTEAELNCVSLPMHKGLLIPHFNSIQAALEVVNDILMHEPSAVELMDQMILDLARDNLALRERMQAIVGRPAALLMIEFAGDDHSDVLNRLDRLEHQLQRQPGVTALVKAVESKDREPLWRLRESGLPLLMGLPGDRKPVSFVEDTAVAPKKMPEFVAAFAKIIEKHGTVGAIYGHASVGCLHIRPVLNMKSAKDVAAMRSISEEVVELVMAFGGSLSGEHGDGLARSEWNRRLFGDELYAFMQKIKRTCDPRCIFNPGKIVDAPPMTENLRIDPKYQAFEPASRFHFDDVGGFARSVELCSGTGVCRKTQSGVMCPSYRATRNEADSTRGRANALRWAMTSPFPEHDLRSDWLQNVLRLCLSCKACKSECPSNVDMARLKAEVDHLYYQTHSRPLVHHLIKRLPTLLHVGSWLSPIVNTMSDLRLSRWLLEKLVGIDRRRSLPPLARLSFTRWHQQHRARKQDASQNKAVILADCFTNYQEPWIPIALVQILQKIGVHTEIWQGHCCGRPLISNGLLVEAQRWVKEQAPLLAKQVEPGQPLLVLEPGCWSAIADDWPSLWPGQATKYLAKHTLLAEKAFGTLYEQPMRQVPWQPLHESVVLHAHCHQKALAEEKYSLELLKHIPELEARSLESGCCGMAGLFGYEKAHFDLSWQIAQQSLDAELSRQPTAIVAATGTSCRHQVQDVFNRPSYHPIQILARQLPR